MAGTFTPTFVTFSNLSRLELEQLRKADFYAGSKALTVGDDGTTLGAGSINAEPYTTAPSVALADIYSVTPPSQPGLDLGTLAMDSTDPSEAVKWFGPSLVASGGAGTVTGTATFSDTSVNFTTEGVLTNDLLVIKLASSGSGTTNLYAVAKVSVVAPTMLTLTNIVNPSHIGFPTQLDNTVVATYAYAIVRQNVIQLFAVPGSGPLGQEQSFLAVLPGSTLHTNPAPTLDQINADRITDLVQPKFGLNSSVDRADAIFGPPSAGPNLSANNLGYRVVLYKSNNTGTGPDLTQPIASLNPVINGAIAAADQRLTIDYKAGLIRFSCAPAAGGDIKPTGGTQGTNPTTNRLQLYAVFWAVDQTFTQGAAQALYVVRTDEITGRTPARVAYDPDRNLWTIGSTYEGNDFTVQAPASTDDASLVTKWGTQDSLHSNVGGEFRGFIYRSNTAKPVGAIGGANLLTFVKDDITTGTSGELIVAEKTIRTFGDGSAPPLLPGADGNPPKNLHGTNGGGLRIANDIGTSGWPNYTASGALQALLNKAAVSGFSNVQLNRGVHQIRQPVYIPPGVTLSGDGFGTVAQSITGTIGSPNPTVFRFSPNTSWGVYDFDTVVTSGVPATTPTSFSFGLPNQKLEGYDIVWNPARRVWGIVQADVTTGSLWFNEMSPDGTLVLPGLGMDIKQDVKVFYTSASANSANHTTGHYPRISHHRASDTYMVVWVVEQTVSLVVGPLVQLGTVVCNNNPALAGTAANYSQAFSTKDINANIVYPFTTHPSVAVDRTDDTSASVLVVTMWGYDASLSSTAFIMDRRSTFDGTELFGLAYTQPALSVVSSTDATEDGAEDFAGVFSARRHPLYFSTTGVTNTAGTFTDPTFTADYTTNGVEVGSRFVVIAGSSDRGTSGIVRQVSTGTLYVDFDGPFNGSPTNTSFTSNSAGVSYALAPVSRVYAVSGVGSLTQIAGPPDAGSVASATWYNAEREPDFVRISKGSDNRFAVVYQTFDVNGAFNRASTTNWDNFATSGYIDAGSQTLASTIPTREHISTCYVILEAAGGTVFIAAPSDPTFSFSTTAANAGFGKSRDIEVISRSLGGRLLNVPYENFPGNYSRHIWEISGRNYIDMCPLVASNVCRIPSLIPDLTWSGSDWTIVSPSKASIHSDTGNILSAGGNTYLSDMTYYFGNGTNNLGPSASPAASDGNQSRATINLTHDHVYFPNATGNKYAKIQSVVSEHTVRLTTGNGMGGLPTGLTGTNNEWYLVKFDPAVSSSTPSAIKNPGFRLSSDGQVTVSSSYMTFADPLSDQQLSIQETVDRHFWGDLDNQSTAQQTSHKLGMNKMLYNDLIPGQRLMADIGFKGVAVGAPKNCNDQSPNEAPLVAIAWGDNFYAAIDRNVAGLPAATGGTPRNQTLVYRQSFGPWRSQIRNLRVQGSGSSAATALLSRKHVFTRHHGPVTGNSHFATDGYRNVFYHYEVGTYGQLTGGGIAQTADLRDGRSYITFGNTITTDAIGGGAIRSRIAAISPGVGVPRNPSLAHVPSGWPTNGNTGKVIWAGTKFLGITGYESGLAIYELPGGEGGAGDLTDDLTGDSVQNPATLFFLSLSALAGVAATTCGAGGTFATNSNTDTNDIRTSEAKDGVQFDVAWSGNVCAIAWTTGHNTSAAGASQLGNVVVGVTLVTPTPLGFSNGPSQQPNCLTFTIDSLPNANTSMVKGGFRDPKIIWDGSNFVMTYISPDNTDRSISVILVPESGFGSSQQVKKIRPYNLSGFLNVNADYALGQINSDGTLDPYVFPGVRMAYQPGDTVMISRTAVGTSADFSANGGGIANAGANLCGWYVVQNVDISSTSSGGSRVDLGVNLTQGGYVSGTRVYGAVFSGGANAASSPDADFTAGGAGPSTAPSVIYPSGPSGQTSYIQVGRNFDLFYNEADDSYISIFMQTGVNHIIATTWKKYGLSVSFGVPRGKDVNLSTLAGGITNPKLVSSGFNGTDLFVVIADSSNTLSYLILSKDLTVKVPVTAFEAITASFGTSNNQRPGPLYAGATPTTGTSSMGWRDVTVKWNSAMGRWVVSASAIDNFADTHASSIALYGLAPLATGGLANGTVTNNFVSYSNRTLTYTAAASTVLAGYRVIGQQYTAIITSKLLTDDGNPLPPRTVNGFSTFAVYTSPLTYTTPAAGPRTGSTLICGPSGGGWGAGPAGTRTLSFKNNTTGREWYGHLLRQNYVLAGGFNLSDVEGGLLPLPSNGDSCSSIIWEPTSLYAMNVRDGTSTATLKVFTSSTDITTPANVTAGNGGAVITSGNSGTSWTYATREDVWMWTFGVDGASVQVRDADEVVLENVEFASGYTDVEERYPNIGRPFWKVNGPTFGAPSDTAGTVATSAASWGTKPHVAHMYSTPIGKAETVRFVNVYSKTLTKYGQGFLEGLGSSQGMRYLRGRRG